MAWDFDVGTDAPVVCPCGDEHCHPVRVRVNQGGRITNVRYASSMSEIGPISGRGTSIAIEFFCEGCGGTHFVAYQFHKGRTYTGRAPGVPHSDEQSIRGPTTLWRD